MAKNETLAVRIEPEVKQIISDLSEKLGFSNGELITRLILKVKDDKELLNSLRPTIK